jgi:hypothetical protein
MDPTLNGNMEDIEQEFQTRKRIYESLVADAIARNDSSKIDAIAAAKQAMSESLSKMLELSARSGTDSQQQELIRRIMEIQRDYNGLLVSTDKLETLRRIHQQMDVTQGTGLKLFGVLFVVAALSLILMTTRTR